MEAEIRSALYSGSEQLDMPMDLQLAAVKNGTTEAKIQITVMLGIKDVPFRKEEDRNCNILITVVAIFDDNGNYVMGGEKSLQLRLTAPTYEKFLNTGVPMRAEYAVEAGQISGAATGPGRRGRADIRARRNGGGAAVAPAARKSCRTRNGQFPVTIPRFVFGF